MSVSWCAWLPACPFPFASGLIEIIPRLHDMSRLLRERFDPDYASGLGHGRPAGSLPPDLALTVSVGCQSVLRVLLSYSVALRFRIFEAEGWLTQGEAPQSRLVLFGGGDAERPQSASEAASMRAAPSATGTPGCLSAAFWQRRRSRQIVVREARKAAGMLDIFTLAVNVQLAQADRPPGHVGGPGTVGVLSEQDPLFRSRSSDSPFVLEDDLIRNPALRKWEDLLHQFDPYPFFANPGYFVRHMLSLSLPLDALSGIADPSPRPTTYTHAETPTHARVHHLPSLWTGSPSSITCSFRRLPRRRSR